MLRRWWRWRLRLRWRLLWWRLTTHCATLALNVLHGHVRWCRWVHPRCGYLVQDVLVGCIHCMRESLISLEIRCILPLLLSDGAGQYFLLSTSFLQIEIYVRRGTWKSTFCSLLICDVWWRHACDIFQLMVCRKWVSIRKCLC